MGAAVAVPIPPGQPAPSDPAAAPQVQSVLTSLSPLLGSGSSTQSSSSFASAATQATGSFLSAVGTNSSAVAVTASAPAVTYASLPPGTTVAGPKQSAANGSPVNIGVAVGAAVGCVVAVGLIAAVVWLLLLRKRGSSSGPAHELAKKQQTSVLAGAQDGQSEGFVNPMANHPR